MKQIDSKTKAALTRAYNKKDFTLPYCTENDTREISKRGKEKKTGKGKKGKNSLVTENDSEDSQSAIGENDEEAMDFY